MFPRKISLSRSVTTALESTRVALQTQAGVGITFTEIDARPFQNNNGVRGCQIDGSFHSSKRMNRKFKAIIWLIEEEGGYIEATSQRYREYKPYRGSLYFPPMVGDHGEDKQFELKWTNDHLQMVPTI